MNAEPARREMRRARVIQALLARDLMLLCGDEDGFVRVAGGPIGRWMQRLGERLLREAPDRVVHVLIARLIARRPGIGSWQEALLLVRDHREDPGMEEAVRQLRPVCVVMGDRNTASEVRECVLAMLSGDGTLEVWRRVSGTRSLSEAWGVVRELRSMPEWPVMAALAKSAPVTDEVELLALAGALNGRDGQRAAC